MANTSPTISSILNFKQDDGTFVAVLPVNTANEVYYDMDNGIKLKDHLDNNMSSTEIITYTSEDITT